MISPEEFLMLQVLEKEPLISITDLSNKTGLSWPTVKKRFAKLKQENLIRTPYITYNAEKLGLQRINVIAFVSNFTNLKIVEQACTEHPYTLYRSRLFAGEFGIFVQFNIPKGTKVHLIGFLNLLTQNGYISQYHYYSSLGIRKDIYPDLSYYDLESEQWHFNWDNWFSQLPQQDVKEIPESTEAVDPVQLKPIHFEILRELSKDASFKQSEIMKKFDVGKGSAFNYYNFIMDEIVTSIRLNYDREYFDLTETYLCIINNLTQKQIKQTYNHLVKMQPPFRMSIDILDNNSLLLWTNMTPSDAIDFGYHLWRLYPQTQMYNLVTKAGYAANYWFYPLNFDFEIVDWKRDESYIVEEPFQRLLNFIKDMD